MKVTQANYEINDLREELINLVVAILGEIDNKEIKNELSVTERLCQQCNISWKDYLRAIAIEFLHYNFEEDNVKFEIIMPEILEAGRKFFGGHF